MFLPISIYVHLPWCIQKCPYCDFNSHAIQANSFLEEAYVQAILDDLERQSVWLGARDIHSIFFGGGTPSLFSDRSIGLILEGVARYFVLPTKTEITLEANPGAADESRFVGYRAAGVNRLSIGVQSFEPHHLNVLGRVHDANTAHSAIQMAERAGLNRVNIDLMFGLPNQTMHEALSDLKAACDHAISHLSWYQLTIEPNTMFYKFRPVLPQDEFIDDMHQAGIDYLKERGLIGYEISAYSASNEERCRHNMNYWEFGDYIGVGAGAHGKLTNVDGCGVTRTVHVKQPKDYLLSEKRRALKKTIVHQSELPFEFMLNALRLKNGVPVQFWRERTGLPLTLVQSAWEQAKSKGLMVLDVDRFQPTPLGFRFLNDLINLF